MVKDADRGTVAFSIGDGKVDGVYSVEELVAMQLSNARKECEKFAGELIRDVVITVADCLPLI